MIRLRSQGKKIEEIATLMDLAVGTVSEKLKAYSEGAQAKRQAAVEADIQRQTALKDEIQRDLSVVEENAAERRRQLQVRDENVNAFVAAREYLVRNGKDPKEFYTTNEFIAALAHAKGDPQLLLRQVLSWDGREAAARAADERRVQAVAQTQALLSQRDALRANIRSVRKDEKRRARRIAGLHDQEIIVVAELARVASLPASRDAILKHVGELEAQRADLQRQVRASEKKLATLVGVPAEYEALVKALDAKRRTLAAWDAGLRSYQDLKAVIESNQAALVETRTSLQTQRDELTRLTIQCRESAVELAAGRVLWNLLLRPNTKAAVAAAVLFQSNVPLWNPAWATIFPNGYDQSAQDLQARLVDALLAQGELGLARRREVERAVEELGQEREDAKRARERAAADHQRDALLLAEACEAGAKTAAALHDAQALLLRAERDRDAARSRVANKDVLLEVAREFIGGAHSVLETQTCENQALRLRVDGLERKNATLSRELAGAARWASLAEKVDDVRRLANNRGYARALTSTGPPVQDGSEPRDPMA